MLNEQSNLENTPESVNDNLSEEQKLPDVSGPLASSYYPKFLHPTPKSSPRDFIFSMLIFISSFLCIRLGFWGEMHLGFTISATILTCVTYVYIAMSGYKPKLFPTVCALGAVACAGVYTLYNSPTILFYLFCAFGGLFCLMVTGSCGHNKYSLGSYGLFIEVLKTIFYLPFYYLGAPFRSFSALFSKKEQGGKFKQVMIGLLLALPALLIIVPLLTSADFAFKYFVTKVFGNFGLLLLQIILAFMLAVYIFSMAFSDIKNLEEYKKSDRKLKSNRMLSEASVSSFLGVISVVYVAYLLSQLAYFTSALQSILPEEYIASKYARRGFFEMAVITCINIILVSGSLLAVKRGKRQSIPLSVRLVTTFIMLFSLVIIGTSLSKMWLYIERFGMTHLRVMTCVFMFMLVAVLLFITVRIHIRNFSYMKAIVTACLIIGITFSYANVDSIIARYNTHAHMSGKHKVADVMEIARLGDAGIPSLVELMDSENKFVAQMAAWQLSIAANDKLIFDKDKISTRKRDLMAFNYIRAKAEKLLLDNYDRYKDTERPFYRYNEIGELIFYEYEEDLRRAIEEYGDYNPNEDKYYYENTSDIYEYSSDYYQDDYYSYPEYESKIQSEPYSGYEYDSTTPASTIHTSSAKYDYGY